MLRAAEDGVYGGVEFKKGDDIIGVGLANHERDVLLDEGRIVLAADDDGPASAPAKLRVVKPSAKMPAAKKSTAKRTTKKGA
jgi:hypothetical protein